MFNLYKVVISWFSIILVLRDALFTIVTTTSNENDIDLFLYY